MHPNDWRLISSGKESQSPKNRHDHQLRNGERAGNKLPVREALAGCRGAAMTRSLDSVTVVAVIQTISCPVI